MTDELHVVYGTGAVGSAVIQELVRQGKRIRAVNRRGRAEVPAEVEVVAGDAMDADGCRAACDGATHVYNCTNPPYEHFVELFPKMQAGILAGAAAHETKLIAMQTVYMYGTTGGNPMTEDTPINPNSRKGAVTAQMHQALMDAHQRGDVRVVTGRASDFFGPRALGSAVGAQVFYPALEGSTIRLLGDADLPHTYSYTPDIGKALVMLGEHDDALGRAWHLPGPATGTPRTFIDLLLKETGQTSAIQTAPKFLVRVFGLFNPIMREVVEMYYQFDEPFTLDHGQFVAAFGDIVTPLEEAIAHTVQWYRDNPPAE